MKKVLLNFLFLISLVIGVSAQTATKSEARKIEEFGVISCGYFMALMNPIFQESQKSPDSEIYVIYYGERYHKVSLINKKTNRPDTIKLKYPHRESGLTWAKTISLYLTTTPNYSPEIRNQLKDRIILVNDGYKENIGVEIWLVPNNASAPKPSPDFVEKDIKFREGKPPGIRDYTNCYGGY